MLSDAAGLLNANQGRSLRHSWRGGADSARGLVAAAAALAFAVALFGPSSGWAEDVSPDVSLTADPVGPVADVADSAPASAGEATTSAAAPQTFQSLDEEAQVLKQQVMDLNRELFMLEEDLLFPATTQVAVYVSYDVGTFFALDSVQVRVDDKEVANYLYTSREVDALQRGGVHRIWLGNLKVGQHVVTAFFTGKGPHDRDYRTGATIQVEKGVGGKYLELKISDRQQKLQPEFIVKQWD